MQVGKDIYSFRVRIFILLYPSELGWQRSGWGKARLFNFTYIGISNKCMHLFVFLWVLSCVWMFCLQLCTCTTQYLLPVEVRRSCHDPMELELWLWATIWVRGVKLSWSARTASVLTCWATSPAPSLVSVLVLPGHLKQLV